MVLSKLSRREFLQVSTAAGAVASSQASSSAGVLGANDRVHFGIIGVGNQGTNHLHSLIKRSAADNIRCVAVSDVYQKRINRATGILGGGDGYIDYRRLLDRKEIDAVLIATPDHWHAKLAIDSMEAGKHVYLEKPMTLWSRLDQAIAVRDTVRRLRKVVQVGPQATSDPGVWEAHEVLKAGRIGKITWAQASYNRNGRTSDFDLPPFVIDRAAGPNAAGENYIDWDMWLGWKWGLAPKIPYNAWHFFRFRKFWAYSGGLATDLLYHKLAPILLAIAGPNGEYPLRATASGGQYCDFKHDEDAGQVPDTYLTTIDYPSEFSVFLASTVTNDTQLQDRIYGKHGTLENFEGDPALAFNGPFATEFQLANNGYAEVQMAGKKGRDMEGNFIDVIRGKGRLYCNAELGAAAMVGIGLGVESFRLNRTMLWDPNEEKPKEG
jgi:predicted dehydrogenase